MKFADLLQITCTTCGTVLRKPLEWFQDSHARCPGCGVDFSTERKQLTRILEETENKILLVLLAYEVEEVFGLIFQNTELDDVETIGEFVELVFAKTNCNGLSHSRKSVQEVVLKSLKEHTVSIPAKVDSSTIISSLEWKLL